MAKLEVGLADGTTPATVPGVSAARRWVLLATMLLGTTLAVLDSSILNLSVVPVMEEFRADLATVEWVLTSCNLAFAAFMIGFGSLGDATGRRRLYVLGQVIFVVGSGLAAIATGPWQLIAFRAIQGVGAAALAPNALALICDSFLERERVRQASSSALSVPTIRETALLERGTALSSGASAPRSRRVLPPAR